MHKNGVPHIARAAGEINESRDGDLMLEEMYQRMAQLERQLQDCRAQLETVQEQLQREVQTRHELERRERELRRQLELANQALNEFAYIVSHDLKAPLRAIDTLANWLATDYENAVNKEGREMIGLLIDRVRRLHSLIEGVRQYSRIGRIKEERVLVDLNQLIAQVIERLSPPAEIGIRVDHALPSIFGEPTRLEQIFHNLIANAVENMDKSFGDVRIGCIEDGANWQFQVADNGPGIERRHWDRIFQIFQTLDSPDETKKAGVGLTLVKKIVELYGGTIWLESRPGQGTTFFFTLPKPPQEDSGRPSPAR